MRRMVLFMVVAAGSLLLLDGCARRRAPVIEPAPEALAERVLIRRDDYGVPHILAEDEEAAAFALGYAQAEDHAQEIGRRYLAARGEAARWFGRDQLDHDLAMQRVDNLRGAEDALETLGSDYRRWIRAFAVGVNHYVSRHRETLPAWMPVVTEADILAHGRASAASGAVQPPRDLLDKYAAPDRTETAGAPAAATIQPLEDGPGSNALALAGSRTTSGHPILLANPHLRWSSLYWEAHITVPGRIDFYGSTLVGLPVIRAGFNQHLGYAQTNNAPKLDDIYAVPLDPARDDHYLFDNQSHPLDRRIVTVDVLEEDGTLQQETREFSATALGLVVHRTASHVFVVRSMAMESWRYHEGFYDLLHAQHLTDFLRLMDQQHIPTSNFTYADAEGNILYLWNARLPRRPEAALEYPLDLPGDSRRLFWQGVHALDELPRLLNPPNGYVQNANNSPWHTTRDRLLDPADYPSSVERRELALRPQMALTLLDARQAFSIDDVLALKFNTRMLLADRVLPDLLAAARAATPATRDLEESARVLDAWDRHVDAGSRGALLFQRFWDTYQYERETLFREAWSEQRPVDTPSGLADPDAAVSALRQAADWVRRTHGALDVPWGDVHRFRVGTLDLPADGASGAYGLYRVMSFDEQPDHTRVAGRLRADQPPAGSGDAWVLLVHFDRPVTAWSVLAYGQSSDLRSPHSRDQIERFARHQLRPVRFTDADIRAHTVREYRPGR